ncbi:hypothetical protein [Robinsoniella peoriensis]|uniref:hypothetical protein n=1 Tax=Robinsoniella peoriensis TaxID=180332 RepID=UPI00363C475D
MTKTSEIKLTDNPLDNIKIMAPLLNEASQNQVFGIMLGMVKGDSQKEVTINKKPS